MRRMMKIRYFTSTAAHHPPWLCCGFSSSHSNIPRRNITMRNRSCRHSLISRCDEGYFTYRGRSQSKDMLLCHSFRKKLLVDLHPRFFSIASSLLDYDGSSKGTVTAASKNIPTSYRSKNPRDVAQKIVEVTDTRYKWYQQTQGVNEDIQMYVIIDNDKTLSKALSLIRKYHSSDPSIPSVAFDCEGVDLSRDGSLTLLTISTPIMTFIIDVLQMGPTVFDQGLRDFLEDSAILKLSYDCRKDSDALWHLYKVKLAGVLDIQVLHSMMDLKNHYKRNSNRQILEGNPNRNTISIRQLSGYENLLKLYCKEYVSWKHTFNKDWLMAEQRPLLPDLIQYCMADTLPMFRIYEKVKERLQRLDKTYDWYPKLKEASQIYVDYYRDLRVLPNDGGYDSNRYLQIPVLMFLLGESDGLVGSASEGVERCLGCHRFVLEKYLEPSCYCVVCQKILDDMLKKCT